VTLVFDIGKTTKKIVVFDNEFHVVEEKTAHFAEVKDEEGFPSEDLQAVSGWVGEILNQYFHHHEYVVTHVNFSAYGASLVNLDSDGAVINPFINYLKPFPDALKKKFLADYDNGGGICATTASPFLGLLNSGLQLYWLKHEKPHIFNRISLSLHFPQYFSYLLTNQRLADITSVGCHTMLWNYGANDYHEWVDKENLRDLFPKIHNTDRTIDYRHNNIPVKVGIGVHDSSAALMPYLEVMKEKFLLLSTGTWNICFNPFNNQLLTPHELSQDCLCYITFDGKPVKASRIFLGNEHELQQKQLASYFQTGPEDYKNISFNAKLYDRVCKKPLSFAPLGMQGTGPILGSYPLTTDFSAVKTFEEAQHHLIRQLVRWQKISIDLLDPDCSIKNVIVVGGFTKSILFLEIMKRELAQRTILVSDHPRASALGAAWLVRGKESYSDKTSLLNVIPA
jgi:sugar (pentulose or hexulose) kinase